MAFLQNRSISLVDMYIDNSEPSENVGQIHFSLEYDFQNTTLILKIIQVSTKQCEGIDNIQGNKKVGRILRVLCKGGIYSRP